MEKQKLFVNDPMRFSIEIQSTNSFFNAPNWDKPMDQNDPFESALTSMVSSPVASNASTVPGGGDGFTIGELIGRLGNICNSGEISPHSYTQNNYSNNNNNNSTNTSCYSTPLNSPPKLNLSSQIRGNLPVPNKTHLAQLAADPGFAERAARFSNFISSRSFSSHINNNNNHSMELSGLSSNQSMKGMGVGSGMTAALDKKLSKISRSSTPEKGEFGDSREESSLSEQIPIGDSSFKAPVENSRKRKAISRAKPKEASPSSSKVGGGNEEESDTNNAKRSKQEEKNGGENDKNANDGNQKQKKENSKAPSQEPPKDYIHVRARRGQATDSHSLAERVRREKISERMKFLQDLVPGCNKVTGKAVMLDEIINYVQSLQRQVEFLSMKLATVNPRMESLLSKDMYQSQRSGAQVQYTSSAATFPFGCNQGQGLPLPHNNADSHLSMNPLNAIFQFNGYGEEIPSYWDDDLQSLVQMGFSNTNQPPSFPGSMATSAQAKLEL